MFKFARVFLLMYVATLWVVCATGGEIAPVFDGLVAAFFTFVAVVASLSFVLYSHIDTVMKDIALEKIRFQASKYNAVMVNLSNLKREVLINAAAVMALLLIERLVYGLSLISSPGQGSPFTYVWASLVSMRVACFAMTVLAAAVQFRGFLTCNQYRLIISQRK